MSKTIRSFKKLDFQKNSIVEINGMYIPVKTLSIAEENSINIGIPFGIPSKIEIMSEKDSQYIKKNDKNFNPLTYNATKIYDKTSKEYLKYEEDLIKYTPILDGIKYINFDYKLEDGTRFIDYLVDEEKLSEQNKIKINWLEMCKYFEKIGITDNVINEIIVAVKALKGDTVFAKISKLCSITGMEYIDIIAKLEGIVDMNDTINSHEKTIDELYKEIEELKEENAKLSIKENSVDSLEVEINE